MKTAGLSSKFSKIQRHASKTTAFATVQENQLRAREKQLSLRLQAERAQAERQKREEHERAKKPPLGPDREDDLV